MSRSHLHQQVCALLELKGALFPREIADALNLDTVLVRNLLFEMRDSGKIQRIKGDAWGFRYLIQQGSFDFG